MLGHSQTAFTMDRYQHVSLAMQRDAAKVPSSRLLTIDRQNRTETVARRASIGARNWSDLGTTRLLQHGSLSGGRLKEREMNFPKGSAK